MRSLWEAFLAFHQNAWCYLAYAVIHNWWFILLAAGAIVSIALYLKEELDVTISEEQQVL